MKNIIRFTGILCTMLTLLFAAAGCAKRPIMQETKCPQRTKKEIMEAVVALSQSEGMEIKLLNMDLGLIRVETITNTMLFGTKWRGVWTFTVNDSGRIQAYAKTYTFTENLFGAETGNAETPYNDEVHESHKWYWNIRNGIKTLCGVDPVFIEK